MFKNDVFKNDVYGPGEWVRNKKNCRATTTFRQTQGRSHQTQGGPMYIGLGTLIIIILLVALLT